MADYESAVAAMKNVLLSKTQTQVQHDMKTITDGVTSAVGRADNWFYIDMVCDEALKIAERDFIVLYIKRYEVPSGRFDYRTMYSYCDKSIANSLLLILKESEALPFAYYLGFLPV
jgi:hypothetical protein